MGKCGREWGESGSEWGIEVIAACPVIENSLSKKVISRRHKSKEMLGHSNGSLQRVIYLPSV